MVGACSQQGSGDNLAHHKDGGQHYHNDYDHFALVLRKGQIVP